ncbi:tyrosine-protein phosphatase non-receptor type 4-like isoform X3 [Patiria miniata]|uniref:protein-tyrosine-phosphatase n=1 Tax=Patiria miniata TaxID=46514 RepID=A0A913YYU4_PATMI|nr:tyrosine-protein phosphatase non-receptor type 4-like isoform X3 [Patiria miniata]
MSRRLRASSGSYNVRANEIAREKQERKMRCLVGFLDDTEEIFEIERRAKGQILLELVFNHLDLIECDYFGLRYSDSLTNADSKRWLDPMKSIRKQVKGPMYFTFAVKFFVSDPSKLQEEYTRYQYVLQLRKDLLEGRLTCSFNMGALLASYIVQAELGDYEPEEQTQGYLKNFSLVPDQTEEFTREVEHLHKANFGQLPVDAEFNFLQKVKNLEKYGVDFHNARDQSGLEIHIGITSLGVVVFQNNVRINTFSWAKIIKISFKRRQFFICQRRELHETRDTVIGFNMASYRHCKNLWKSCVEHHTFFRLVEPQPQPKKRVFFQLGSKFRYSGRTEYQTVEDAKRRLATKEREFQRSPSKRLFRRTISGTTSEIIRTETRSLPLRTGNHKPLLDNHTVTSSLPTRSSKFKSLGLNYHNSRYCSYDGHVPASPNGIRENGISKSEELLHPPKIMFMDDGGSDLSLTERSYDLLNDGPTPNGTSPTGDPLVSIRIKSDDRGRFGFNVKGGADQGSPIIVSRVARNTPADQCIPRLNEGDQILFLNGKDLTQYTNEKVVSTIRSIGDSGNKDLLLTVRPNVYVSEEAEEEPAFQYIPESPRVPNGGMESDPLIESIMMLQEGLESGTALTLFEQLYRKKPGLTMNACRHPDNVAKNRYRDIAPYDATRIMLQGSETGDYINANLIKMEIPVSDVTNSYIAAQGPLPNTCGDFWYMVWEQESTLIAMLTTNVERGRVKCHKYWPELGQKLLYPPHLEVACTGSEETPSFAYRDFIITHTETGETRKVLQMQYIAWPDHGVPDDSSDFLDFVIRVRQYRVGMTAPTLVHCSAGIGRTGVLITMETAMCLIESNQPVYPLDIVRTMRDQRAMLIQTTAQYRFVCEAILRVYMDGIVVPLEEFKTNGHRES